MVSPMELWEYITLLKIEFSGNVYYYFIILVFSVVLTGRTMTWLQPSGSTIIRNRTAKSLNRDSKSFLDCAFIIYYSYKIYPEKAVYNMRVHSRRG